MLKDARMAQVGDKGTLEHRLRLYNTCQNMNLQSSVGGRSPCESCKQVKARAWCPSTASAVPSLLLHFACDCGTLLPRAQTAGVAVVCKHSLFLFLPSRSLFPPLALYCWSQG
jgi:hypothetical protein